MDKKFTKEDMETISLQRAGGVRTTRQHRWTKHSALCDLLNRRQPLSIAEISEIVGLSQQTVRNYIAPMMAAGVLRRLPPPDTKRPRRWRAPGLYVLRKGVPNLVVKGARPDG